MEGEMKYTGYTYLNLIEDVLRVEKKEMTLKEIWKVAQEKGFDKKLTSVGKTPVNTMNASIRRHIETADRVKFKQTSERPALYYLN